MPLDLPWLLARLPERHISWRQRTGSTMTEAARLLRQGFPSGTIVLAEEQSAGQGRLGRSWYSEPETGLYASVVLRLPLAASELPLVTLALGLATVEAIALACGVACDLRWPNDVMIGDRKCAGILVQAHGDQLVAGIGINVSHSSFPEELATTATSLLLASGRAPAREVLLVALIQSIDRFTRLLVDAGPQAILQRFSQASTYVHGRRVVVERGGTRLTGATEGLDPSGFLILRKDDGARELILAGGVRPA